MKSTSILRNLFIMMILVCISSKVYTQEEPAEDSLLRDLILEYSMIGYNNVQFSGNLDTAEYYIRKALDLQYSASIFEIDVRVAINHVSLASVYRLIYNNSEGLDQLNEAEKIMNDNNEPNNLIYSNIYHNKGNLYKVKNDLYRTKQYYEYALDFVRKIGSQNTINFAHIFSNYLYLLFELEEFDLAEEQLSLVDINSLNVSPSIELKIHLTNAYAYSKLNNYELVIYHLKEAKKIIDEHKNTELINLKITYYCQSIDFHILYSEYSKALKECDQAFLFVESLDPSSTKNKSNYQSFIIYRSATIQFIQGNLAKALKLVDGGIE